MKKTETKVAAAAARKKSAGTGSTGKDKTTKAPKVKAAAKTAGRSDAVKAATEGKPPPAEKEAKPRSAATRAPAPPAPRRVIFIDVENTSGESTLEQVLVHLNIDRKAQPTELLAVGNWKSVGAKVARMLGHAGAKLMHSAPAPGVRDWSDLWIAVQAGRWLGTASPGDCIEIVSDDHAFDAVADAAAAAGVEFRRISYRKLGLAPEPAPKPATESGTRRRGGRRGRGRGRGAPAGAGVAAHANGHPEAPARREAAAPAESEKPHANRGAQPDVDEHAHGASIEHVRALLARLSSGGRWLNLDILSTALKNEGFSRPPGSPRLVTRLRHMKGVEISSTGMVRWVGDGGATPAAAPAALSPEDPSAGGEGAPDADATAGAAGGGEAAAAKPASRRRSGRSGRGRRGGRSGDGPAAPQTADSSPAAPPAEDKPPAPENSPRPLGLVTE